MASEGPRAEAAASQDPSSWAQSPLAQCRVQGAQLTTGKLSSELAAHNYPCCTPPLDEARQGQGRGAGAGQAPSHHEPKQALGLSPLELTSHCRGSKVCRSLPYSPPHDEQVSKEARRCRGRTSHPGPCLGWPRELLAGFLPTGQCPWPPALSLLLRAHHVRPQGRGLSQSLVDSKPRVPAGPIRSPAAPHPRAPGLEPRTPRSKSASLLPVQAPGSCPRPPCRLQGSTLLGLRSQLMRVTL